MGDLLFWDTKDIIALKFPGKTMSTNFLYSEPLIAAIESSAGNIEVEIFASEVSLSFRTITWPILRTMSFSIVIKYKPWPRTAL